MVGADPHAPAHVLERHVRRLGEHVAGAGAHQHAELADAADYFRFTMTGPDTIVYEATYDDPVIFTAPWTARLTWTRDDSYEFFEYACNEGNQAIRNNILATRAGRREARP